ncbi:hypothetical protein DIX90_10115 [Streptococcus iniae]|uniref:ParB N-terminal domain-containing protein n=1 Tax=Streptococcus TaxID=1301 RepID=UPI000EF69E66|nr:ParB N-terminal domain-containing protein [Streptococcus iniae]RLU41972.1 hypothetical protein DIY18_10090 [Streptococcus iniae]RLU51175.1 hypothetical protein DIY04_11100 [Streptococcus iniae]RLU57913.1 hypothetical protein DIY02_10130 [Streptococcus iniae]RLU59899.1 hypothetical protein DIY01_10145 [Streptococcus iniae]RLU82122.1 hypothetical protein DIX91_10120 [Streptococcus iniae]
MRTYSHLSQQQNIFNNGTEINTVYKTTNYDMFNFSKFNRNVFLTPEMLKQAELGFVSPIIVNENLTVIDGQHRLTACQQLGLPVEYIIKKGLGEDDIVRMNTVQKPWKLINYIEAYANEGRIEYVKLLELINTKDYYQSVAIISQVAVNSINPRGMIAPIQNGEFKFFNYEKTVEFLSFLRLFKEKTRIPYRSNMSRALYQLFQYKKINMDLLITRVIRTGLNEELIVKSPNYSECMKELLTAYNFRISNSSPNYVEFFISSAGSVSVQSEKHDWAMDEYEKE